MPDFGRSKLNRYTDRFYVDGFGRFAFSILYHDLHYLARMSGAQIEGPVRQSAAGLLFATRQAAPVRSGDLRSGIIQLPGKEKTSVFGKVVSDIVIDAGMNETFVKYTKDGTRYYYPASQEYGFRIGRGKRVPGLYYMRNTAMAYYAAHEENVVQGVMDMLEEV